MPKVSVIVPVYNVQRYLRKCLDSIVSQSLKDIEIILIDDGSTDKSGLVCDEYAEEDSRIKVIHKKNEGLSCARNDGVEMSTAPYLMFVDSDDWLDPGYCEIPYLKAVENDANIILFSYNAVDKNGSLKYKKKIKIPSGMIEETEALRFNLYYSPALWPGLFHRKLFDSIRFPAGKCFEEIATSFRLIHSADRICFVNKNLYYYRIERPGSITSDSVFRGNPDYRRMVLYRIKKLYDWGYKDYARISAFHMIIRYGWKSKKQRVFVDILRNTKGVAPKCFRMEFKGLFVLYKYFRPIFDVICIITGKRLKGIVSTIFD